MSVADEVASLRTAVTLADGSHLACVRVAGPDAFALVDAVSPRELFIRSGQMIHTIFLDAAGCPIADVYVACDDDAYLVIAEGPTGPALAEYLRGRAAGLEVELGDLGATCGFLCLNGPYAWELLAELTSPEVIGLPYLGFFHQEDRFTCFRAGKCGEYGYDLLIPRARLDEERARIAAAGAALDLATASLAGLEHAALENFFWNVRREVRPGLTPIELQLQWRVSPGRDVDGAAALEARRRSGPRERAVLLASTEQLAVDAAVLRDGREVGRVLHAIHSPTLGGGLAVALIERPLACAGLAGFSATSHAGAAVAARTISAPAVNNRSLYVDPQRHTYATRAGDSFPPLVRTR